MRSRTATHLVTHAAVAGSALLPNQHGRRGRGIGTERPRVARRVPVAGLLGRAVGAPEHAGVAGVHGGRQGQDQEEQLQHRIATGERTALVILSGRAQRCSV
eukprot:COSAG02_NODE_2977_length_7630_cov_6.628735_4_plen_102_part_00